MQKNERSNNKLQNITHEAKDRLTRTPIKTGGELTTTNKTDRHNITEILLKVALNTVTLTLF
jgi:hypothetical protein